MLRYPARTVAAIAALLFASFPIQADEGQPKKVEVSGAAAIQALPPGTPALSVTESEAGDLVHLHALQGLRVLEVDWVDDAGFKALSRLTWLEDLKTDAMEGGASSLDGYRELGALKGLKRLAIGFPEYETPELLTVLASLPALEDLEVGFGLQPLRGYQADAKATGAHLAPLAKARRLRALRLESLVTLADDDLAILSKLRKLEVLHVSKNGYVGGDFVATKKGFRRLEALPVLRHVTLAGGTNDAHLEGLSRAGRVTHLVLSASRVGDRGFRSIEAMRALKSIDVLGSEVSDEGLAALAKLDKLETLGFSRAGKIRGSGLRHLRALPALRKLELNSGPIEGSALAHVGQIASLEVLDLSYCKQIDDASLAFLRTLPKLKELSLYACEGIGNEGLEALAALSSLESLNLGELPRLTNEGLQALEGLSNLRRLDCFRCSGLTQAGLRRLAAKLPQCTIQGNRVPE